MSERTAWLPEIMYEEDPSGVSQSLPFILVPEGETMPTFLLVWENSETGEIEPGPNGEEIPIVDAELRQYARMDILKEGLTPDVYDQVRMALGLDPLKTAVAKGRAITSRVRNNLDDGNANQSVQIFGILM